MASNQPREYAVTLTGTSVGGDGGTARFGAVFGFDASQIILANDGSGSVYFSLASTAGSTGGFEVRALEAYALDGVRTYGFGVASTTTSTEDTVRIGAWCW